MKKKLLFLYLTILLLIGLSGAAFYWLPQIINDKSDLPGIQEKKKLRVITAYNPIGYFLYKDEPLGFEYELLKSFADSIHVELEVVVVEDPNDMYNALYEGKGDIMAYHIPIENQPGKYLQFSEPYVQTEQVIVQKKVSKKDPAYIGQWQQMKDKTITISEGAHYANALQNLNFELQNKINLETVDGKKSSEDLIRMVSEGLISYTVSNKEIALINKGFYDNIDIETSITAPQDIAFAVHRKHHKLLKALNKFIAHSRESGQMYALYDRYFKTSRLFASANDSTVVVEEGTGTFISSYDALIQKHAVKIGWDWRLVAALIWQESRFKPQARSWAGATGLMQLMPATARRFGLYSIQEIYHPEENIRAGTEYLAWLDDFWKDISDPTERLKFIMGSYNAGQGHVKDAQRLAQKFGYETQKWDGNVEYFLLNKSKPQFYRDPVCKHGYCRGSEPFHYVRNIVKRYEHYKKNIAAATGPSYSFNTDFAPAFEMDISDDMKIQKRALFEENSLFKERGLVRQAGSEPESKYHNTLQPKSPFKNADTILPKRPALQQRGKVFEEKPLFRR